jgi:hypothetical protein
VVSEKRELVDNELSDKLGCADVQMRGNNGAGNLRF